jgi:hypothetical protein
MAQGYHLKQAGAHCDKYCPQGGEFVDGDFLIVFA